MTLVLEDPGGEPLDGFISGGDGGDAVFRLRCRRLRKGQAGTKDQVPLASWNERDQVFPE